MVASDQRSSGYRATCKPPLSQGVSLTECKGTTIAEGAGRLWRQFLGEWRHAHGVEHMAAGLQIAFEGAGRHPGEPCQLTLADVAMGIHEECKN